MQWNWVEGSNDCSCTITIEIVTFLTDAHNEGLCMSSVASIAILAQGKLLRTLTYVIRCVNTVHMVQWYVCMKSEMRHTRMTIPTVCMGIIHSIYTLYSTVSLHGSTINKPIIYHIYLKKIGQELEHSLVPEENCELHTCLSTWSIFTVSKPLAIATQTFIHGCNFPYA